MKMMQKDNTIVVVIRNGIAKELHLPIDIVKILEEAYEKERVVGISQDTYNAMAEMMSYKLMTYHRILSETEEHEMFDKAIAFAQAFDIYSDESPLLFEIMCWINREVEGNQTFSSRDINCKTINRLLKSHRDEDTSITYRSAMKDFKSWARCLFSSCDLHVGFVKFAKFYYSVVAV